MSKLFIYLVLMNKGYVEVFNTEDKCIEAFASAKIAIGLGKLNAEPIRKIL